MNSYGGKHFKKLLLQAVANRVNYGRIRRWLTAHFLTKQACCHRLNYFLFEIMKLFSLTKIFLSSFISSTIYWQSAIKNVTSNTDIFTPFTKYSLHVSKLKKQSTLAMHYQRLALRIIKKITPEEYVGGNKAGFN